MSPCDGKILSFGEVDSDKSTLDCIKGHSYHLDEFLLGYQQQRESKAHSPVERIVQSAKDRDNKIMFMVVYLSPGDYHRYHSPAAFTASYRRHVAGYLEPVDPRYLKNHRDVLKSNERVNLLGNWTHGFFGVSFVGALNVGSIKVHFDETLLTNKRSSKQPYISDRNYASLNESDRAFVSYPIARQSSGLLEKDEKGASIDQFLTEFDIKDMLT